jgi:DNA-binding HxlR family transcriptional regulator
MRHKSFDDMQCPIARSLERVGEWWSMLILRDALLGLTRFDQFQESLGIASNMLIRRLSKLVEAGLLERRRYNDRPPRYEYLLTQAGRDFRPVLWAFVAWGNRHFAPEGPSVVIVDSKTGKRRIRCSSTAPAGARWCPISTLPRDRPPTRRPVNAILPRHNRSTATHPIGRVPERKA